jgi:hypothetical protein
MPVNLIPCPELTMVTNILLKPKSSQGVFLFTPDLLTQPASNYPLDVNVSCNARGDIKLVLLDDNQAPLFTLVLKCSQYDINEIQKTTLIPDSVKVLYEQKEYTQIVSIGTSYLSLIADYVEMEETAYLYRQVSESYLSFWRTSNRRNGIMQHIIKKTSEVFDKLNFTQENSEQAVYVWCLSQTLLRSRIIALRNFDNEIMDTLPTETINQQIE